MPTSDKRDLLVRTALRLFAAGGFHATGIDRVVAEAGVSKKTLYHHFRSKDELVLAVLQHYDGTFRNDFMRRVERRGSGDPVGRLLAVFDAAEEWFEDKRFHGCLFINAIGEFSQADSAVREACNASKRRMRAWIEELATAAGIEDAREVADELALLFDGATVRAQVSGRAEPARTARRMARRLIESRLSRQEARA